MTFEHWCYGMFMYGLGYAVACWFNSRRKASKRSKLELVR